jgi:hypothetical protein
MNVYAIVVGINEYVDPDIPSLLYAEQDANSFAYALYNSLNIPKDRIRVITGNSATRKNICTALKEFCDIVDGTIDLLFFYFSGHGLKFEWALSRETHLATVDTDPFNLDETSIGLSFLYKQYISQSKAKTVLAVLDSCYSGTATETQAISELELQAITLFQQQEGRFVISSCSSSQISKEDKELENGVFTHYLVEGLWTEEAADQETGELTVPLLFNYTSARIREAKGVSQDPHWGGRGTSVVLKKYNMPLLKWEKIYRGKIKVEEEGYKPVCGICGTRYGYDNMYICMSCANCFCYRCINRFERVTQTVEGFYKDDWHRCFCGGLIN